MVAKPDCLVPFLRAVGADGLHVVSGVRHGADEARCGEFSLRDVVNNLLEDGRVGLYRKHSPRQDAQGDENLPRGSPDSLL